MSSFLGPFGLARDSSGVHIAFPAAGVGITPEGGLAVKKFNGTGSTSVKGTVIQSDGYANNSFVAANDNDRNPIGVVYENGVPNSGSCWVVIYGVVEVLIKDGTSASAGYWVKISDVAGRADITTEIPAGGGIPETDEHFKEMGHCMESVASGTDKLALIFMHFN